MALGTHHTPVEPVVPEGSVRKGTAISGPTTILGTAEDGARGINPQLIFEVLPTLSWLVMVPVGCCARVQGLSPWQFLRLCLVENLRHRPPKNFSVMEVHSHQVVP